MHFSVNDPGPRLRQSHLATAACSLVLRRYKTRSPTLPCPHSPAHSRRLSYDQQQRSLLRWSRVSNMQLPCPRPRQSHLNDGGLFAAFCMADRHSARASTLPFPHSFRPPSVDQRQRNLQRPGSDFNMQSSCDPSPNVTVIAEGAPDTRLRCRGSTESRSDSALFTSCTRTTNQACSPHHAANTISPPSSALDTAWRRRRSSR